MICVGSTSTGILPGSPSQAATPSPWGTSELSLRPRLALDAIPFYESAGFRACDGEERLTSTGVLLPIVRMEKMLRP